MTDPTGATPGRLDPASAEQVAGFVCAAARGIEAALLGKHEPVTLALVCLLARGHLLIEDVPGTGKTTLAKSIASTMSGQASRIQFTPDLLPTDITGVSVFDQRASVFEFRPGPVFANVVVADEINRASPKTQSALLEVMEEGQVTADGVTHAVPEPFMVVATQNPVDLEGTYRLPEAQLDRFAMRISVGHPDVATEAAILQGRASAAAPDVPAIASLDQVRWLQDAVTRVHLSADLARYVADLAAATRAHDALRLGVSTRGSLVLVRAAQAHAAAAGRHYVVPDDLRTVLAPVVAHRLVLTAQSEVRGQTAAGVLAEVVAAVPVPATPAAVR